MQIQIFNKIFKEYSPQIIKKGIIIRMKRLKRILKPLKLKIFVSTVPKSGTNLLKRFLSLLLDENNYFYFDYYYSPEKIAEIFNKASKGGIIISHSFLTPQIKKLLKKYNFKILLLLRDPRDIAVSYIYYILTVTDPLAKELVSYYKNLPDNNARLMSAIVGPNNKEIEKNIYIKVFLRPADFIKNGFH